MTLCEKDSVCAEIEEFVWYRTMKSGRIITEDYGNLSKEVGSMVGKELWPSDFIMFGRALCNSVRDLIYE